MLTKNMQYKSNDKLLTIKQPLNPTFADTSLYIYQEFSAGILKVHVWVFTKVSENSKASIFICCVDTNTMWEPLVTEFLLIQHQMNSYFWSILNKLFWAVNETSQRNFDCILALDYKSQILSQFKI